MNSLEDSCMSIDGPSYDLEFPALPPPSPQPQQPPPPPKKLRSAIKPTKHSEPSEPSQPSQPSQPKKSVYINLEKNTTQVYEVFSPLPGSAENEVPQPQSASLDLEFLPDAPSASVCPIQADCSGEDCVHKGHFDEVPSPWKKKKSSTTASNEAPAPSLKKPNSTASYTVPYGRKMPFGTVNTVLGKRARDKARREAQEQKRLEREQKPVSLHDETAAAYRRREAQAATRVGFGHATSFSSGSRSLLNTGGLSKKRTSLLGVNRRAERVALGSDEQNFRQTYGSAFIRPKQPITPNTLFGPPKGHQSPRAAAPPPRIIQSPPRQEQEEEGIRRQEIVGEQETEAHRARYAEAVSRIAATLATTYAVSAAIVDEVLKCWKDNARWSVGTDGTNRKRRAVMGPDGTIAFEGLPGYYPASTEMGMVASPAAAPVWPAAAAAATTTTTATAEENSEKKLTSRSASLSPADDHSENKSAEETSETKAAERNSEKKSSAAAAWSPAAEKSPSPSPTLRYRAKKERRAASNSRIRSSPRVSPSPASTIAAEASDGNFAGPARRKSASPSLSVRSRAKRQQSAGNSTKTSPPPAATQAPATNSAAEASGEKPAATAVEKTASPSPWSRACAARPEVAASSSAPSPSPAASPPDPAAAAAARSRAQEEQEKRFRELFWYARDAPARKFYRGMGRTTSGTSGPRAVYDHAATSAALVARADKLTLESKEDAEANLVAFRTKAEREAEEKAIREQEELAATAARLAEEQRRAAEAERRRQAAAAAQRQAYEQQLQREASEQLREEARLREARDVLARGIIPTLSQDAITAVNTALANPNMNKVLAKSVDGTIDLARGPVFGRVLPHDLSDATASWLNDDAVNAWFIALCARKNEMAGWDRTMRATVSPPVVAFSSAWYNTVTDGGKIRDGDPVRMQRWGRRAGISQKTVLNMEKIFFPLNQGNHWTLLCISPKDRKIQYLDSLGGKGAWATKFARKWLRTELGPDYVDADWTTDDTAESQRQRNMSDCGVFACYNGLAAVSGRAFDEVNPQYMVDARAGMLAMFLKGGFRDEMLFE